MSNSANPPKLFIHPDGRPVRFYFWTTTDDRAISNRQEPLGAEQVRALENRVRRYGGVVSHDPMDMDVMIVNESAVEEYQEHYSIHRHIDAEHPGFIDKCIREGGYKPTPRTVKPLSFLAGGRRRPRKEFTSEDIDHLVEYIAIKIPDKSHGGRHGVKIYQDLVDNAEKWPSSKEWSWAKEHPWQAWRERYVKHEEKMSKLIDQFLAKNPPRADGKGRYPYSSKLHRGTKGVRIDEDEDDEEEDWEGEEEDEEEIEKDVDDFEEDSDIPYETAPHTEPRQASSSKTSKKPDDWFQKTPSPSVAISKPADRRRSDATRSRRLTVDVDSDDEEPRKLKSLMVKKPSFGHTSEADASEDDERTLRKITRAS